MLNEYGFKANDRVFNDTLTPTRFGKIVRITEFGNVVVRYVNSDYEYTMSGKQLKHEGDHSDEE